MLNHFQTSEVCYFCGTTYNLERHHIFYGTANRKKSEKYNLTVLLCHDHHTGSSTNSVHFNREMDLMLKEMAQEYWEEHFAENKETARKEFIAEFGKSVL